MASSQDFLAIVEEYLSRDQIYRPADEFVMKLALSPHLIGGPEKKQHLQDTLLRMVAVVKSKLNEPGRRNKTALVGWLKAAAKALNDYQVISREWICDNVWELPALPQPKEQDYDSTKGRRDYRFFPSKKEEEQLLVLTEDEAMDVQLDYNEEVLLVMTPSPRTLSPEKTASSAETTVASPQNTVASPRKTVPSSKKAVTSPRIARSPRKTVVPRTTVEKSASRRPEKSLKSAPQPRRKGVQTPKVQIEAGRSSSGTSVMRKARAISPIKAPTDKRKRASSSGMQSAADRGVFKWKRTVCIRDEGTSDRSTSQRLTRQVDDLVVSAPAEKRSKPDLPVPQVPQEISSRRNLPECWIPGCTSDQRFYKAHAFYDHLPSVFSEHLDPSNGAVLSGRRNALNQAGRWLVGRPVTLEELVEFIRIQNMFNLARNSQINDRLMRAMREFCQFNHVAVPTKFVIDPCNSIGVLLHWRVLMLIASMLSDEQRDFWRKTFRTPEQPIHPEAFDSHFHLDRTLSQLRLSRNGSLEDIVQRVPVDDRKKITLVGTVAIYCDPDTYPTDVKLQELPSSIMVGAGIHPRHARNRSSRIESDVRHLRRLLQHPRVIALGEVGLDHTEPIESWASQVKLLEKVFPLIEDRHVLVIHCRGMDGDCGTEAFMLLLHFMKKNVRSFQPIHLHCFTGNQYVLDRWLEVFPRTYFGFTNLARTFNADQITALCNIDERRLLLEADAPYFPVPGCRVRTSSPSQIFVAAEAIATHRGWTVDHVLGVTKENAQYLYNGQQ